MIKTLIKNDIFFLRKWLSAWAVLLMVPFLLFAGLRTELGWDPAYWSMLQVLLPMLMMLQVVYQVLLIAMLVQKESPSNPAAYWRTRPVTCLALPAAKLLSIACFILLPQIAQGALLGWMFPGGVEAIWDGAAILAFLMVLLILFALPSAALTRNGGQALLFCIAIPVGVAVLDMLVMSRFRIPAQMGLQDLTPSAVSLDTILLWLLAICVVFGFRQCYRAEPLRRRRGLVFLPALLLLFLVVNMPPAPKPIPEATLQLPPEANLEVESVSFELKRRTAGGGTSTDVSGERDLWLAGGAEAEYGLSGKMKWSGLPEHLLAIIEPVRSFGPDGRALDVGENPMSFFHTHVLSKPYRRSLFPEYDRENRIGFSPPAVRLVSSRRLEPGTLEWPAEFTTVFATRLYESEKVLLPFTEGARWSLEGQRVIVGQIQSVGDGVTLQLQFLSRGGDDVHETPFQGTLFALHDPQSGAVAFGRRGSGHSMGFNKFLALGRYELVFNHFPLSHEALRRVELYHIRHALAGIDVRSVSYPVNSRK